MPHVRELIIEKLHNTKIEDFASKLKDTLGTFTEGLALIGN